MALKVWNVIYKSKPKGNLGFKLFNDFYSTLLAKLAWKFAFGQESFL